MKKIFGLLLVVGLAAYVIWGVKSNLESFAKNMNPKIESPAETPRDTSRVPTSVHPMELNSENPAVIANEYLTSKKEEWKIQPYHELRTSEVKLPLGTKITYSVFQDGVAIPGQEIQIVISKRGKILSIDNQYQALEKADPLASDYSTVLKRAKEKFEVVNEEPNEVLLYVVPGIQKPAYAYPITVKSKKGIKEELLIRASDGEVIAKAVSRKEF